MPSPTFTLVQTYDLPRFPLVHADLYRAVRRRPSSPSSASTTCPSNAVVLLEWPDRAAGFLPPDRLDIAFTLAPQLGPNQRHAARHRLWHVRAARSSGWPRSASSSPRAA